MTDMTDMTDTTTTTITFFYDQSDARAKGWAYRVTTHMTGLDDDGNTVDIDHDETSGPVDVRRIDAGLPTIRRAFFRSVDPTSAAGKLRRAFATAPWGHGPHHDRLVWAATVRS